MKTLSLILCTALVVMCWTSGANAQPYRGGAKALPATQLNQLEERLNATKIPVVMGVGSVLQKCLWSVTHID